MAGLIFIRDYIAKLDSKQMHNALLIFGLSVFCSVSYLLYVRQSAISELRGKLFSVNKERLRTQKILTLYNHLKEERQEANALLDQDKNFRLLDYFTTLLEGLGIATSVAPLVSSPRDLDMGYNEIELTALFRGITTKQMVTLLEAIDKNRRVYTKELVVDKSPKNPTIDIKLIIATLEPVANL